MRTQKTGIVSSKPVMVESHHDMLWWKIDPCEKNRSSLTIMKEKYHTMLWWENIHMRERDCFIVTCYDWKTCYDAKTYTRGKIDCFIITCYDENPIIITCYDEETYTCEKSDCFIITFYDGKSPLNIFWWNVHIRKYVWS